MKERFFQYILRIFSAIYNPNVFIFFIFFYYVITIVEAVTFWRMAFVKYENFCFGNADYYMPQRSIYYTGQLIAFCNPFAEFEKKGQVSTGIPSPWSNDLDISCRNSVNNLGLGIPPCRTPNSLFNISLMHESHFTRHSALENILFITFKKLPSIPLLSNL